MCGLIVINNCSNQRDEIKDPYFIKRLEIEKIYELAYLVSIYYQLGIGSNLPISLEVEHYQKSGLADFITQERASNQHMNKKDFSDFKKLFYKSNYEYRLSFHQFLENKMNQRVAEGKI